MSDLKKTVDIVFSGEDKLSGTLAKMKSGFGGFASGIGGINVNMAKLAKTTLVAGAAFTALATGSLALVIREAATFDSAFREITTLIDDTGESIERFRDDILSYGRGSTASLDDITRSVYSAISAGVDYEKVIGSLADAEKLSISTKADLEVTLKTLASTLNSYGESTDQAQKYAEIFFETVKNGQTTMPELSASLANVTSIAASSGVPFSELSAAIAALTATGMPTAQAITSIRGAIVAILKPTADAKKTAKDLGIEFNATALESKGFAGIIKTIGDKTGGSTEKMSKLFGSVEALSAALVLSGKGSDKFINNLETMEAHTGSLGDAFDKMTDQLNIEADKAWNSFKITMVEVGLQLQDEASDILKSFSRLMNGLSDTAALGTATDAIESLLRGVADTIDKIDMQQVNVALDNTVFLLNKVFSLFGKIGDAGAFLFSGGFGEEIKESPILQKIPTSSLLGYLFSGDLGMDIETAVNWFGKFGDAGEDGPSKITSALHKIPWDKAKDGAESVINEWSNINDKIEESIGEDLVFTPTLEWDEDGLKPLELIPTEKIIEIQLQGDIDRQLATIEAHADIVQNAMEWEAKLSIATAEADAQRVASAFTATASAIDSTASSMSGLLDAMSGDFTQRWEAEKALDQQLDIQREQADLQAQMLEAQIKYMELKNEKIERGESLIQIDSTGLEPALEMVMWQILEKVQIRAAENLDDYLLGIPE